MISATLYFGISDFPEEVKWLSSREKAFVKQRLHEDVGYSNHQAKHSFKDVLGVLKDCRPPNVPIVRFPYPFLQGKSSPVDLCTLDWSRQGVRRTHLHN